MSDLRGRHGELRSPHVRDVGLLVAGLVELVVALTGTPESRALSAIGGVLAVLAGIVCLRRPGESLLVLVIVLGLYLVASGLIHFLRAFSDVANNRAFGVRREQRSAVATTRGDMAGVT